MAMSANGAKSPVGQSSSRRSQTTKAVVPANSREATARKLEPEIVALAPEADEFNFEGELEPPTKRVANREAEARRTELIQHITRLMERRDEYVERLDVGASKIEEKRTQGKDVTAWEDYWIQLLHQYEAVCDKLRDLQAEM